MKKLCMTFIAVLLAINPVLAQNEMDALRYSQVFPGGTARFSAMGGSFGALGGDFSSLSINPAGIGIYRSSEFMITPVFNHSAVETSYFNTREEDMKYNFNLNNVGVVFAFPVGGENNDGGWQFVNLGFGINRHNNFNDRWITEGFNPYSTMMASMLQQAESQGLDNLDPFSTGLAWETFLLDTVPELYADMLHGVNQRQETNTSGHIRELVLTMGANYNDRLYLGATVGFPSVSYEEESVFMEEDIEGRNEIFNSMTYANSFKTTGSGYNFKVGAIFRLTDMVRIGGAFHTPTFYDLTDRYSARMTSDLNLDDYNDSWEPEKPGRFDYDLETPFKAIGSLGLVFGSTGAINVDYEYIDYTAARLRSRDYMFSSENRQIRNHFTEQHNIRIGGELNLEPLILRGGYGYYSNPYRSGINDATRQMISAGLGIRESGYFIDFSYVYSFFSEDYQLYLLDSEDPADYNVAGSAWQYPVTSRDFSASTFRLTFGWRF